MRTLFTLSAFALVLGIGSGYAAPSPTPSPEPTALPILHPDVLRRFEPIGKPVDHTSVKDQGNVGFCWSYSSTGRIESEFLRKTGKALDLSEEYIGFFHIYDQILAFAPTYFTTFEKKPGKSGFGAGLIIYFFFHPGEGAPDLTLANTLIDKYGIVPESAFNYKIHGGFFQKSVEGRVRRFINQVLRDPVRNREFRETNVDGTLSSRPNPGKILTALAKIYTLESEFDAKPAPGALCNSCRLLNAIQGFTFAGTTYTPKSFAKNYLGFKASDYEQITVTEKNQAEVLTRLGAALDAGQPAEIGITLFNGYDVAHKTSGVFAPESCGKTAVCEAAGGHALLVVNRTMDPRTRALNGIVVRNSWGTEFGRDADGDRSATKGYDIVTIDYLNELFSKAKVEANESREWSLLLKKTP